MQPVDAAWLAGLLEGEGCFYLRWTSGQLNVGKPSGAFKYPNAQIIVQMTDLDVLEKVQQLVGGGSIYPCRSKGNHKPLWRYTLGKRAEVLRVIEAVRPFLGVRRTLKINEIVHVLTNPERRSK